jgi:hypothetical protein
MSPFRLPDAVRSAGDDAAFATDGRHLITLNSKGSVYILRQGQAANRGGD